MRFLVAFFGEFRLIAAHLCISRGGGNNEYRTDKY